MGNISTYVSGHTELTDVSEFFQKQLLHPGERPIAFFDGVFYESHQERVGNIVYQDYLIYSDRAVYLWARGATKDFLDRFPLGAVTINSRNKDSDFATLNLRIRRENKEPVYVIFDMVEIDEAEKISTLHTIIESTIENYLGSNFKHEIPDEVASSIYSAAQGTCPPRHIPVEGTSAGKSASPSADSNIGYGQDLLEQYKASIGYPPGSTVRPGAPSAPGSPSGGNAAAQEAMRNLEGVLPTDPESLKRVAANLKDMIGDAPFKFRDQVMKDLQHIPNDVATVLTAVNELISNIADNPQAEKFVMNAIQTAVKNDGIIGSFSKLLKLSSSFGPMGKKPQSPRRAARQGETSPETDSAGGFSESEPYSGIRRKKIRIQTEGHSSAPVEKGESSDTSVSPRIDDEPVIERKRIRVKVDESVKSPLTTGPDPEAEHEGDSSGDERSGRDMASVRPRKIGIRVEEPEPVISIDEELLSGALKEAEEDASEDIGSPEKPENALPPGTEPGADATHPSVKSAATDDIYTTLESEPQKVVSAGKKQPAAGSSDPSDMDETVKKEVIKVKSTQ